MWLDGGRLPLDTVVGIDYPRNWYPHIDIYSQAFAKPECMILRSNMVHDYICLQRDPVNQNRCSDRKKKQKTKSPRTYLHCVHTLFPGSISKLGFAAERTRAGTIIDTTSVLRLIQIASFRVV